MNKLEDAIITRAKAKLLLAKIRDACIDYITMLDRAEKNLVDTLPSIELFISKINAATIEVSTATAVGPYMAELDRLLKEYNARSRNPE